jgi:hypothetical protein
VRLYLVVVGLVLWGVVGLFFWDMQSFTDAAVRVRGVVVDLEMRKTTEGGWKKSYYPVVRFQSTNGQEVQFVSGVGSSPAAFERGEEVEVLYDPAAPEEARIDSWFDLYFVPILAGALGSVFLLSGIWMFVGSWRSGRKQQTA